MSSTTVTAVTVTNRYTDAPVTKTFPGNINWTRPVVAAWLRENSCLDESLSAVPDRELVEYLNNHPDGGYQITVTEQVIPVTEQVIPVPAPAPEAVVPVASLDVHGLLADLHAARAGSPRATLDRIIAKVGAAATIPTAAPDVTRPEPSDVLGVTFSPESDFDAETVAAASVSALRLAKKGGWYVEVTIGTESGRPQDWYAVGVRAVEVFTDAVLLQEYDPADADTPVGSPFMVPANQIKHVLVV